MVTFIHGVTDDELSRVSQLSWAFYLTVSTTGFTLLFLFILLHTTLYCKYLSCLSVVLCLHISHSPFLFFLVTPLLETIKITRTKQPCNANIVPITCICLTMMLWKFKKRNKNYAYLYLT